ncbi:MAG: cytidine deaminase [Verrucomicrobiales bacterium]|jgi:cytidine deaminase
MEPEFQELITAAVAARKQAYAPYSHFAVGAALLTASNEVILGCNVENASYGLTICAERSAIFTAIGQGHTKFQAIAISLKGSGSPCGACRQVLNEFAPESIVIMADEEGLNVRQTNLAQLLPEAFGPINLQSQSL